MKADVLKRYLARILRSPILDAAEEADLVRRWRTEEDYRSLEKLVNSHLRLVVKIARGFKGYGLPFEELIATGNLGLVEAAKRFDPNRSVRFSTYATWWVRAALQSYVMQNCSIVKMASNADQKKLFFKLRGLKSRLKASIVSDLTLEQANQIAEELQVPMTDVIEMNRRLSASDVSLNERVSQSGLERGDLLIDETLDPESQAADADERRFRRLLLADALACLEERERRILIERRLREVPTPLHVLGREIGVSGERIRQLERRAVEKIRRNLGQAQAGALGAVA